MLFKNKIEYTKGMFVEIYGTEIKKVRLEQQKNKRKEIEEAKTFEPKVVFVDDENQISRCTNYERHGRLEDM